MFRKLLIPILFSILYFAFSTPVQAQQPVPVVKSNVVRTFDGVEYYIHTVQSGQTYYSLTRFYGITQEQLIADNPILRELNLQAGMVIKIRVVNPQSEPTESLEIANPEIVADSGIVETADNLEYEPIVDIVLEPLSITNAYPARDISTKEIVLMLPLTTGGKTSQNSASLIELYEGVLVALAEYRDEGVRLNLSLYDTQRSGYRIKELLYSDEFVTPDLIIGPVYEDEIAAVMEYIAEIDRYIPVVSPLATTKKQFGDRENFFQFAPDPAHRFEKFRYNLFEGDKNIVIITTETNDSEMEASVLSVLGRTPYKRVVWDRQIKSVGAIEETFSADRENVFIITSGNEVGVDMILAQLSSIHNRRIVNRLHTAPISVIGSQRWLRYDNMDKTLLFKLNVSLPVAHYVQNGSTIVQPFRERYVDAFDKLPTQYAERGYDIVRYFVGNDPTLNRYNLKTENSWGYDVNVTNINWSIVNYTRDFTIEVW